jgi:hypothetical protein
MTENKFTTEKNEQHPTSPVPNKSRIPWHSPLIDVLKGSDTESDLGGGKDGGTASGFQAS